MRRRNDKKDGIRHPQSARHHKVSGRPECQDIWQLPRQRFPPALCGLDISLIMVFYECLLTTKNTASFSALTNLMKGVSHKIVDGGGIVRGIRNHGVRDLPHRFKARYPDRLGNRHYKQGRFVSMFYDASPQIMRDVESILRLNEEVLRDTHLKARNKLWYVNIAREDKNPYIQRVLDIERAAGKHAAAAKSDKAEDTKLAIE